MVRNSQWALSLVLGSLLLAACGGSSACDATGAIAASCTVAAAGQCVDFSGLGRTDATTQAGFCRSLGGSWDSSSCPTAGRLGTCQLPAAAAGGGGLACSPGVVIQERYYPPGETSTKAEAQCAAVPGTTWTPG